MEPLGFYAHDFCELSEILGVMRAFIHNGHSPSKQQADSLAWAVKRAHQECTKLELPTTTDQCEEISALINGSTDASISCVAFAGLLRELQSRLRSELSKRIFLALPSSRLKLYVQKEPLFGSEVERKFPSMSEDISEAGKCLALARPTACVFHLMRVMESCLQKIGTKLQIRLVEEKVWQVILDQVNKAIKQLNPKDSQTQHFAEIAAHLYNVKLAWRNEVMHPKQTYTDEEAEKVFSNVREFVEHLVTVI